MKNVLYIHIAVAKMTVCLGSLLDENEKVIQLLNCKRMQKRLPRFVSIPVSANECKLIGVSCSSCLAGFFIETFDSSSFISGHQPSLPCNLLHGVYIQTMQEESTITLSLDLFLSCIVIFIRPK